MPTTSSYGDLAAILSVGALFYIGYQSFTNSAVVGAVAKDPCAGLTGATLAACRKAHPEYKGITPSIAKKPLVPAGGGVRLVSTGKPAPVKEDRNVKVTPDPATLKRLGFNLPGGFRNVTLPPNATADEHKKCETMVLAVQKYLQERKPIDKAAILRKYRSFGYTEKDLDCGIKEAQGRIAHTRQTGDDSFEDRVLVYNRQGDKTGSMPYGAETTDKPGNTRNPIDHFVNGIASFLQQAWNNLTQGKTAIGGSPTVITGARPMVAPIV